MTANAVDARNPATERGPSGGLDGVDVGGGLRLKISHPQDMFGVLEVNVMDVSDSARLPKGSLVIDLGAGIGDFAVLASRRVGPLGRVIALEPNPSDFEVLRENVRTNGCGNVTALNNVLAEDGAAIEISFKGHRFLAQPVSVREVLAAAGLTLELAGGRPVALKIDIEGAEAAALTDLRPLLPTVETVAIELHGTQTEVAALLRPFGFVFQRLTRATYLLRSARFVLRHPRVGFGLWLRYRASPRSSGVAKILQGIDIAASPRLRVGVYRRPKGPAR